MIQVPADHSHLRKRCSGHESQSSMASTMSEYEEFNHFSYNDVALLVSPMDDGWPHTPGVKSLHTNTLSPDYTPNSPKLSALQMLYAVTDPLSPHSLSPRSAASEDGFEDDDDPRSISRHSSNSRMQFDDHSSIAEDEEEEYQQLPPLPASLASPRVVPRVYRASFNTGIFGGYCVITTSDLYPSLQNATRSSIHRPSLSPMPDDYYPSLNTGVFGSTSAVIAPESPKPVSPSSSPIKSNKKASSPARSPTKKGRIRANTDGSAQKKARNLTRSARGEPRHNNSRNGRKRGTHPKGKSGGGLSESKSFKGSLPSKSPTMKTSQSVDSHTVGKKNSKSKSNRSQLQIKNHPIIPQATVKVKPPPKLKAKRVQMWSVKEVARWLAHIRGGKYRCYCRKFIAARVNGTKLFKLTRLSLQNEVKVMSPADRKDILMEMQKLQKQMREVERQKVKDFAAKHTRRKPNKQSYLTDPMVPFIPHRYVHAPLARQDIELPKTRQAVTLAWLASNLTLNEMDKDTIEDENSKLVFSDKNAVLFIVATTNDNQFQLYLTTKDVSQWAIADVTTWIANICDSYFTKNSPKLLNRMMSLRIDGNKLLSDCSRSYLQNTCGIIDVYERRAVLREIRKIRKEILGESVSDERSLRRRNGSNALHRSKSMSRHRRTASQIERDKQRKADNRKLGPRDIGRSQYKGTKLNPQLLGGGGDFLGEHLSRHASNSAFQKRKEANPLQKKETVAEIGKVHGYKSQFEYDPDSVPSFLEERVAAGASSASFERRKAENPLTKKQTVAEIGRVSGYKGTKYDFDSLAVDGGGSPNYYLTRRHRSADMRRTARKLGPRDIGKTKGYHKPQWSGKVDEDLQAMSGGDPFEERPFYQARPAEYYQSRLAKMGRAEGPTEIGWNKEFQAPDYVIRDNDGDFLEEHLWYTASKISDGYGGGLSRMVAKLPPAKLRVLMAHPPPTGIKTKVAWLKMLRDLVAQEITDLTSRGYVIAEDGTLLKQKKKRRHNNRHGYAQSTDSLASVLSNDFDEDIEDRDNDANEEILAKVHSKMAAKQKGGVRFSMPARPSNGTPVSDELNVTTNGPSLHIGSGANSSSSSGHSSSEEGDDSFTILPPIRKAVSFDIPQTMDHRSITDAKPNGSGPPPSTTPLQDAIVPKKPRHRRRKTFTKADLHRLNSTILSLEEM